MRPCMGLAGLMVREICSGLYVDEECELMSPSKWRTGFVGLKFVIVFVLLRSSINSAKSPKESIAAKWLGRTR